MKMRATVCLIYLSTFSFLAFGQQAALQAERQPTPTQLFKAQRGEAEYFKTLVYRYEVAWEDADIQSMSDLRDGLAKLMAVENEQLVAKTDHSAKATERLARQQTCLKQLSEIPLSANDGAFGKKAEQVKTLLHDFVRLMEADLAEQAEALQK